MAASPFDEFFKRAVDHEGRVCEDVPGDLGGPTKWGVTIGRLAEAKGEKLPKRGGAAWADLKQELYGLSEDEIATIYRRDYWDAVRGDDLPSGIDYASADFALNSGPSRAVKLLQRLLGQPVTGKMSNELVEAAKAEHIPTLIGSYCDERAKFLQEIAESRPANRKFLKGWLARVGDVRKGALDMAKKERVHVLAPIAMPKAEGNAEVTGADLSKVSRKAKTTDLITTGGLAVGAGGTVTEVANQVGDAAGHVKDANKLLEAIHGLGNFIASHASVVLILAAVGIVVGAYFIKRCMVQDYAEGRYRPRAGG